MQKEKPIPIVPCSDAFISDMRHYELQRQLQFKKSASQVTNSSSRFSRDNLKETIVINQVDSKFIVCLLPSDPATDGLGHESGVSQAPSRTLVLVDQHAADERVRVEWLQREICLGYLRSDDGAGIERTILDPPVPVLLTKHEKSALRQSDHIKVLLASWGVEFAPIDKVREGNHLDDDSDYSQVMVTSIPAIVNHRVRATLNPPPLGTDERTSCLRETNCSISSKGYSGITQMTRLEGCLLRLSRCIARMSSLGKGLYDIVPLSSWNYSIPRLAEVRHDNHLVPPGLNVDPIYQGRSCSTIL